MLKAADQPEWLNLWRRRQWKWAGKLMQQGGGRWSQVVLDWQPNLHSSGGGSRAQARPRKRWEQDISIFVAAHFDDASVDWKSLATQSETWAELAGKFEEFWCTAM